MLAAFVLLFSLGGVVALAKKSVDYVGWARAHDWDAMFKTTLAIAVAIGLSFLLWAGDLAKNVTFTIGGQPVAFKTFDAWTVLYVGVAAGAIAAWGVDVFNTRTTTPIVGSTTVGQPGTGP